MKKFVLSGAAFILILAAGNSCRCRGPADRAGLRGAPGPVGLLNWTGFYIGANFGYARSPAARKSLLADCRS
jgi:hypothetical protein